MAIPVVDGQNNLVYAKTTGAGTQADPFAFVHEDSQLQGDEGPLNPSAYQTVGTNISLISALKTLLVRLDELIYDAIGKTSNSSEISISNNIEQLLTRSFTINDGSGFTFRYSQQHLLRAIATLLQHPLRGKPLSKVYRDFGISTGSSVSSTPVRVQGILCHNLTSQMRFLQLYDLDNPPSAGAEASEFTLPLPPGVPVQVGKDLLGEGGVLFPKLSYEISRNAITLDPVVSGEKFLLHIFMG